MGEGTENPKTSPASSPWSSLIVTLAVTVLVVIASRTVGIPGVDIDESYLDRNGPSMPSVRGVLDLGLTPFLTASVLVEIAAIIVPSWRRLRQGLGGRRRLAGWSVGLAMVLGTVQAMSVAKLLASIEVVEDGFFPRLVVVVSLVAGLALMIAAAQLITRRGLGNGYMSLVVFGALPALPSTIRAWLADGGRPLALVVAIAGSLGLGWLAGLGFRASSVARPPDYRRAPERAPIDGSIPSPADGMMGTSVAIVGWSTGAAVLEVRPSRHTLFDLIALGVGCAVTAVAVWLIHRPEKVARAWARAGVTSTDLEALTARHVRSAIGLSIGFTVASFAVAYTSGLPSVVLLAIPFVALVRDATAEIAARSRTDLVSVAVEHRVYSVGVARAVLAEQGISLFVRAERTRALLSFFGPYVPMELCVPRVNEERATGLLAKILDEHAEAPEAPAPLGHLAAPRWRDRAPVLVALGLIVVLAAGLRSPWLAAESGEVDGARATSAAGVRPGGVFELSAVDDEVDPFVFHDAAGANEKIEDAVGPLPRGLRIDLENAPIGYARTVPLHYATLIANQETMVEARTRLDAWLETLRLPPDHRFGVAPRFELNEETQRSDQIGWRTYVLRGAVELDGHDIATAVARPGNEPTWAAHVVLELTGSGAERFEALTARSVQRRIAIVVDGTVASAPVVQDRIRGGQVMITMGAGSPEQQLLEAKQLAERIRGEK